ncbi:MAG: hypothetical protein ABW186_14965 [Rhodanobacteraceae bacterium]
MSILGTGEALAHQYVVKRGRHRNIATPFTVIPAKAGIHCALARKSKWIPAFAGMTGGGTFAESRKSCDYG